MSTMRLGRREVPKVLCFSLKLWDCLSSNELIAISGLGASAGPAWHDDVTHLVTETMRRTETLMCAICRGIPIITPRWVAASISAGYWVETSAYSLRDAVAEAALGVELLEALARARKRPLLCGYGVYYLPTSPVKNGELRPMWFVQQVAVCSPNLPITLLLISMGETWSSLTQSALRCLRSQLAETPQPWFPHH